MVKALLVAGLWLAGWGAARLVAMVLPEAGASGQFVAITLAIWNPYVGERLLQGHWSLLLGYGCLPWVATTVLALRSTGRPVWSELFGLVFWIALAGLTPTGLILAAVVGLVCVAVPVEGPGGPRPRWMCAALTLGAALVAALPWLTAAALGLSSADRIWARTPDVAAFAARAEPGLGTLGSLASLGGIWNGEAVPASRATLFAVVSAGVLFAVVVIGYRRWYVAGRRCHWCCWQRCPWWSRRTGHRAGPIRAARGGRGRARPGRAARRAEVGGAGDARIRAGRCRRGADVAALARLFRAHGDRARVLCGAAARTSRLGVGRAGKVEPVHYPTDWTTVAALINRDPGEVAVCRPTPCGSSPGPGGRRSWIRCRAGCAPTY